MEVTIYTLTDESRKERDDTILRENGCCPHAYIRVSEDFESVTFIRRLTGKPITFRY